MQSTFSADPERRVFDFTKTSVAPVIDAFYCPVTRRLLDRAPFGLTPYGLEEQAEARRRAIPVAMPRHPAPMLGLTDVTGAREAAREWIDNGRGDRRSEGQRGLDEYFRPHCAFRRLRALGRAFGAAGQRTAAPLRARIQGRQDQHPQLLHHDGDGRRHRVGRLP